MGMELMSPYGQRTASSKVSVLANQPDELAIDAIRGQGNDPAFGRYVTSGDRQINASSNKDLMYQISAIRKNAQAAGGLKTVDADPKIAQERWASFKAAFRNTQDARPFQVVGEVMSDSLNESLS